MYINAVQRAVSIGGFVGDEIMIAMGDMAQNLQKSALPGWMQSFYTMVITMNVCMENARMGQSSQAVIKA